MVCPGDISVWKILLRITQDEKTLSFLLFTVVFWRLLWQFISCQDAEFVQKLLYSQNVFGQISVSICVNGLM